MNIFNAKLSGDSVASWLVHEPSIERFGVKSWPGDILLCSWARHFTLTAPLSTQVHKWVPVNLMQAGGNPAMDEHPIHEGVEVLLVASCYRDERQLDGRLGS